MLKLAPRYVLKSLPKSLPRFVHTLLVLSLLLPLAHGMAAASPSSSPSGSFKSGFSSQRSSSSSSSKGGVGSFGKRPSSQAGEPSKARGGGFGSFGGAAPSDARRSDSALSRKLDRDAAAARALRTLDERRAAQAARNAPRDVPPMRRDDPRQADNPPPAYGNNNGYGYGNNNNGRTPPSGGDLGRVIAGAVIANAAANAAAHAANNTNSHGQRNEAPMPAPSWNGGVDSVGGPVAHAGAAPAQPKQGGGSVFGTVAVLLVLALAGWLAWKWIMRARARRAADKPNYSFERN